MLRVDWSSDKELIDFVFFHFAAGKWRRRRRFLWSITSATRKDHRTSCSIKSKFEIFQSNGLLHKFDNFSFFFLQPINYAALLNDDEDDDDEKDVGKDGTVEFSSDEEFGDNNVSMVSDNMFDSLKEDKTEKSPEKPKQKRKLGPKMETNTTKRPKKKNSYSGSDDDFEASKVRFQRHILRYHEHQIQNFALLFQPKPKKKKKAISSSDENEMSDSDSDF